MRHTLSMIRIESTLIFEEVGSSINNCSRLPENPDIRLTPGVFLVTGKRFNQARPRGDEGGETREGRRGRGDEKEGEKGEGEGAYPGQKQDYDEQLSSNR